MNTNRANNKANSRNEALPAKLWDAVQKRDRRADGSFFFGVRSTQIYCRPSCPARRPLQQNTVFFRTPDEAERGGYRPCRRCRPREQKEAAVLVSKAAMLLAKADPEDTRLEMVAGQLKVSQAKLRRAFHQMTGLAPRGFAEALRMERFRNMLRGGKGLVEALYECGFGSPSRIYEKSDAQLGMTPAVYRKGAPGMELNYGIVNTSLGKVLVAGTTRGVSAVYLGENEQRMVQELKQEYPRAAVHEAPSANRQWLQEIVKRVEGDAPSVELPLDVQATAFQRRVWQELQKIPAGATKTYTQIARAIGDPRAVRAVARACATNPVSIVVPCHRVVRKDGNLAGYRWGLQRKQELLQREAKAGCAK